MAKKKHGRKKATYKKSKAQRKKQQATVVSSPQQADGTNLSEGLESGLLTGANVDNTAKTIDTPAVIPSSVKQSNDEQAMGVRARREVRHSLVLAVIILAGLLALWALFAFTSLGSSVYQAIKL